MWENGICLTSWVLLPWAYLHPPQYLCAISNPLLPFSDYKHSQLSQWSGTPRSNTEIHKIIEYLSFTKSLQISSETNSRKQFRRRKNKKRTFLGEISACFFWTCWCNSLASCSHTWHLMYGMSSFLATPTGFLEQCERGIHAATTTVRSNAKNTPFIIPTTQCNHLG